MEEKRIKDEGEIFKEIRTKNLQQVKKELTLHIKRIHRMPERLNEKKPHLDLLE